MTHHELLEQIVNNIKEFYPCKFVSTAEHVYGSYYYNTVSSDRTLTLGFDGGCHFVLGRNGKNQYKKLYIGSPVIITSEGIRFIQRPDIITRPGPASVIVDEDKTIDVYCKEYSDSNASECYFNLCMTYPEVPENVLRTAEYFCLNPVPKGVYMEINSSQLGRINMYTSIIKDKVQCKN